MIPRAFAETVDSTAIATASSDASSVVVIGPPLVASLSSSSPTSSASSTASSSAIAPAPEPVVPDENFLDVSYSTDGQSWISIGKVNANNWRQFTITLPISNWSDLVNLQIRVEGIPTTASVVPPIYLDGMLVEVHYDEPPALLSVMPADQSSSSAANVIQVSPGVTVTMPIAPTSTPTVPAPTITDIAKTASHVTVTVQYVGDFYGGNPLYLFVYPAGTMANRNDADSAFTFAGTPQEGSSINAAVVTESTLDPTSKQATVTIVTPVTHDDSQIATDAIVPGTYDVDVSYFDSQTWHIIPAETFTWP